MQFRIYLEMLQRASPTRRSRVRDKHTMCSHCTSLLNLSIILSPSVVMAMISFQINLKSSGRSVTNLSKVSALSVLQSPNPNHLEGYKVGAEKEHVHCEVIPQVSLVPLSICQKSSNQPPASYSFLRSTTVSSFATSQNSFTFAWMVR